MGKVEVRISGLGGQGVVLAGQVLGRAAVYGGKKAVQTQSYGAEVRGTLAKSEVIISDERIGFPMVRKCDVLIAMSQEALDRNINDLKEGGILLLDSSVVKNVPNVNAKVYRIPATKLVEEAFGSGLYANMVMLGALTEVTGIVSWESLEKAVKDSLSKEAVALNVQACLKGKEFVKQRLP